MPCTRAELEEAKEDGIKFELFKAPLELTEEGVKYIETRNEVDESGRVNTATIEGTEGMFNCDSTIIAVSQSPRKNIVANTEGLETNKWGLLLTDENGHTTREGAVSYTHLDDIDLPIEIKIRDTIIKIIKEENLNIESKLLISYRMLLNILDNEELTEEIVLNELEKYNNIILQETLQNKSDYNKTFRTINNLFLDIIENYKDVPVLKLSLIHI